MTTAMMPKYIFARKDWRIPSRSPLPANCAPKIDTPESPPKMVRLNTIRI